MARFVIRETTGKQINLARLGALTESARRPMGIGVVVLDSQHCYRLCGEFHSETRAKTWKGATIGPDGARAAAEQLAARLEAECAMPVAA